MYRGGGVYVRQHFVLEHLHREETPVPEAGDRRVRLWEELVEEPDGQIPPPCLGAFRHTASTCPTGSFRCSIGSASVGPHTVACAGLHGGTIRTGAARRPTRFLNSARNSVIRGVSPNGTSTISRGRCCMKTL